MHWIGSNLQIYIFNLLIKCLMNSNICIKNFNSHPTKQIEFESKFDQLISLTPTSFDFKVQIYALKFKWRGLLINNYRLSHVIWHLTTQKIIGSFILWHPKSMSKLSLIPIDFENWHPFLIAHHLFNTFDHLVNQINNKTAQIAHDHNNSHPLLTKCA